MWNCWLMDYLKIFKIFLKKDLLKLILHIISNIIKPMVYEERFEKNIEPVGISNKAVNKIACSNVKKPCLEETMPIFLTT